LAIGDSLARNLSCPKITEAEVHGLENVGRALVQFDDPMDGMMKGVQDSWEIENALAESCHGMSMHGGSILKVQESHAWPEFRDY
jgi:hypothetical protein